MAMVISGVDWGYEKGDLHNLTSKNGIMVSL